MTPRIATITDIPELARLQEQSWAEAYSGLLPPEAIAKRDVPLRVRQWEGVFAKADSQTVILTRIGFA